MSTTATDLRIDPSIGPLAVLQQRIRFGLPGHLGIEVVEVGTGYLVAQMKVRPVHMAVNGYLHGGSVVTLADTSCGFGCMANLPEGAFSFTTVELKSNFVGTATSGVLRCQARMQHGGRTTQVWDAVVVDENDRRIALFRCTQLLMYSRNT